jgi:hypothetical protein
MSISGSRTPKTTGSLNLTTCGSRSPEGTKFVMWQSKKSGRQQIYCQPGARYEWPAKLVQGNNEGEGNRYMTIHDGYVELATIHELRTPKSTTKPQKNAKSGPKKARPGRAQVAK